MRFYNECIGVAKSVAALLTERQLAVFSDADTACLADYQLTIGLWIRNHLLPHNTYLSEALSVLGYATTEEQVAFLVVFSHQYWKLNRAGMM